MADKQPLNATFFAFRKRERSGVLLGASVAFLIVAAALIGGFVALFWSSLTPVINWYAEVIAAAGSNNPEAMANLGLPMGFFTLILGVLVWSLFFYILCAAYEAACLKWMIHGETRGFMGLSLGADTWRVWGVYWIWFLLNMAFSFVMSFIMIAMMGVVAVSSGGDPLATTTVLPVYYVLHYGLMAYFAVRLAPAAAATIARRRFSFFEAWVVSRGRFWALFGSFFVLWLIYLIVGMALGAVWIVSVMGASLPDVSTIGTDPERFNQWFIETIQAYLRSLTQPQSWVVLGVIQAIGMIAAVVFYVATFGVNARAALAALEEGKIKPAEA
jgi:hypothetical protein